MKLVIRPAARADIEAAKDDDEERRPGVGQEIGRALDDIFARLDAFPRSGSPVAGYPEIRRVVERRFRYGVWYRYRGETLEVLRVIHHARSPAHRPVPDAGEEEPEPDGR